MDHKEVVVNFDQVKLKPVAFETPYVFVSLPNPSIEIIQNALCTFKEPEGVSLIISKVQAKRWGLDYESVHRLITIGIYSSLEASGLTAKISAALVTEKIPCNVVAAYHHDHLLVPENLIAKAMKLLEGIS